MLRLLPFTRFISSVSLRSFSRVPIILGDLGEGTKEATVKTWFLQEGAEVQEVGNRLCYYSTMISVRFSLTSLWPLFLQLFQAGSLKSCKKKTQSVRLAMHFVKSRHLEYLPFLLLDQILLPIKPPFKRKRLLLLHKSKVRLHNLLLKIVLLNF